MLPGGFQSVPAARCGHSLSGTSASVTCKKLRSIFAPKPRVSEEEDGKTGLISVAFLLEIYKVRERVLCIKRLSRL